MKLELLSQPPNYIPSLHQPHELFRRLKLKNQTNKASYSVLMLFNARIYFLTLSRWGRGGHIMPAPTLNVYTFTKFRDLEKFGVLVSGH